MIIIGEKLNGSIPSCAKAIAERNADYIRDLVKKQSEAGADLIDVCASVNEGELQILDRKSVAQGKSVVPGGCRTIKKKTIFHS